MTRRAIAFALVAGSLSACGSANGSTNGEWSGRAYVQVANASPDSAELCFGASVGSPGSIYIAGCPGLRVRGVDVAALEPSVQRDVTFVAVEITGTLNSSRTTFEASDVRRLAVGESVVADRQVGPPADWDCETDTPPISGAGDAARSIERMPLAVIEWSDELDDVSAVAVDDDWFERACDAGLVPVIVRDYLRPA